MTPSDVSLGMLRSTMLVVGMLVVGWTAAATAQETIVDIAVSPETELTVGDTLEIRVRVQHEPGERVVIDGSVFQMGGMEPSAPIITAPSETETLVTFQTRSFEVGVFDIELPPMSLQQTDGAVGALALPPISVSVTSVLNGVSDRRPLTAPDLLGGGERTFMPWIVAIVGIGAGFALARVIRRRLRRPSAEPLTASDADQVNAPASFAMDGSLSATEQCRQLAAAVRARLAEDWSLPAAALTSAEIGPALAQAGAPSVVVLRVTRLLEACDRVLYGGEQPTAERLSGYAQLADAIWSDGTVALED